MGRPPRYTYAGAYHHVSARCNNKEFQFTDDRLFERLLSFVAESRRTHRFRLLDYCLMTNHFHLLIRVPRDDTLPKAMHAITGRFSRWFNAAHGRCGHLWEGRYRSTVIEAESYLHEAMLYLDLNPVRAGITAEPWGWPWSGCSHLAAWRRNDLIDEDPLYHELGRTAVERKRVYREMLADRISRGPLAAQPELSESLFVGTRPFIEAMVGRFGRTLVSARTSSRELGGGVLAFEMEGRGGHRTSKSSRRPAGRKPPPLEAAP
jgi:putative transposase